MMEKYRLILIGMLTLLLIGNVLAYVDVAVDADSSSSFFKNIIHSLEKAGIFTAQGQDRKCSVNPDYTLNVPVSSSTQIVYINNLMNSAGCSYSSALIDVFDGSYNFRNEYRSEEIGGLSISPNTQRIIEVYCCPYHPCSSNSGCSSAPASNYGNTCNPTYGSCYSSIPTHSTSVYQCTNNQWVYLRTVSYDSSTWCADSGDRNYLNPGSTTAGSCLSSGPSWCGSSSTCKTQGQSCTISSDCCSGLLCQNFGCYPSGTECTSGQTSSCSITNGQGTKTCGANGYWAACIATSCNAGYVVSNNQCVSSSNIKPIGESCGTDAECISNHCDKKGWWIFGTYKCAPIPWSEEKRLPVTKSAVSTMTTQDKLAHICATSSQCLDVENYSVSCIPISVLKEEGVIPDAVSFLDGAKITIDSVVGKSVTFAIGGAVVCGGTTIVAGLACLGSGVGCFTLPAAMGVCTTVTGGAALIGAGVGYSSSQHQIAISEQDPLVKAVQEKDESSVGICIAEESSGLSGFLSSIAFFDVTGDGIKDETDGTIIAIIGLILLFIIIK